MVAMLSTLLSALAALVYLFTGGLLGRRMSHGSPPNAPVGKSGLLALGLGAAFLHGIVLLQTVHLPQGLNLGFFNALSFTGWLIAVLLLAVASLRPVENLGVVLLPFSALTLMLALMFPSRRIIEDASQWPLELHILISILAYSLLTLAAVQAILLAIQDHRLRSRQLSGLPRGMPPLVTMETLLFQMIGAGFVTLSLALLSGFLFLEDIFAQHLVHKTVLSLAAWGVFGTLLWGRFRFGWRGRKTIRWTLFGFTVLALAYFGSKLVLELVLRR